ncbi:MAG: cobalamin-binding domain-containing protein [Spirochaetes bacterium]|nr:MAG: cobalamin-binding domain-containing protein [Spirochaetota bacterium]
MKISSYHKQLGDNVFFHKGINASYPFLQQWDRVYISTLFTYNWKITVDTINFYKAIIDDIDRIKVGGILATLKYDDLWEATGVVPIKGLLNRPGMLGDDNEIIVDELIPDYSLFNDTPFKYSLVGDSYLGYSTRGCKNKCKFCGVPEIEPQFQDYINIKEYVNGIKNKYGEKTHLVLMDNNILASKSFNKIIRDIMELGFEKNSKLNNKQRHVDFNQGVDARRIDEKNIHTLAKIAINPLRIAFDSIKLESVYRRGVELAAQNGIQNLSNYILYNYNDSPEELWKRLEINIQLNRKYGLNIYSFPMKYIPLLDTNRKYISSPNWNWQFIRGVQRILNVLKGAVMPREDFFYRAFGESEKEFREILYMPESILMNRGRELQTAEIDWKNKFRKLTQNERDELLSILCGNPSRKGLMNSIASIKNKKLHSILTYYIPKRPEKNDYSALLDLEA